MMKKEKGKRLEDYEPGASREEVHQALRLVAKQAQKDNKKPQKPNEQSEQA